MSRRTVPWMMAFVLAHGVCAEAAPILDYIGSGGGEAWVGSNGLYVAPSDIVYVDCCDGSGGPDTASSFVRLTFSAGPPTAIDQRPDGGLVYHFGGGTLTFYQDSLAVGIFAVLPFTYTLGPLSPITKGLVDPFPDLDQRASRPSTQPAPLGIGVLDHVFAAAMGVSQNTSGGEFVITLDNFTPVVPNVCRPWLSSTPDPFFHCGVVNYAYGQIVANEVPEPAAFMLIAFGAIGWAARRTHPRRRRT